MVKAIIQSKEKWNDTGIDVVKDVLYTYSAKGIWKDSDRECDANGYSNFMLDIFSFTKRTYSAKWFQLIGVINKDSKYTIKFRKDDTFIAPENGRLWAYANDACFAYKNNSGYIELELNEQ